MPIWKLLLQSPLWSTGTNDLLEQFSQVARVISARDTLQAERQMFYLELGGFDTHSDVGGVLEENFAEIDAALASFVAEMEAQGRWGDVAVLSVSEFGRTISSNGNGGTDHGWGGNHVVLGGAVKGGQVFGQYPDDLSDDGPLSTGRGRIIPTTPWDGVWAPMAEWLGVEAGSVERWVC